MNDYTEIQKLYEEGYRGQSFDPIQPPNYYPAKQDWGPYSRPIPGSPEASGYSQFRKNQVGNKITRVIDEEIPEKEISNIDVLKKLDELVEECKQQKGETDYSVLQLLNLKDHIISLSR